MSAFFYLGRRRKRERRRVRKERRMEEGTFNKVNKKIVFSLYCHLHKDNSISVMQTENPSLLDSDQNPPPPMPLSSPLILSSMPLLS